MEHEAVGFKGPARTWSLRREWSRAFTVMVVLLLVAATVSIVGVWDVVAGVRGTAAELHRESVSAATLSTNLVAHEEVAHKMLSDEPVNRSAFLVQQRKIWGSSMPPWRCSPPPTACAPRS